MNLDGPLLSMVNVETVVLPPGSHIVPKTDIPVPVQAIQAFTIQVNGRLQRTVEYKHARSSSVTSECFCLVIILVPCEVHP